MISAPAPQKVELLRRRTVSESLAAAFAVFQQIGRQIITITAALSGPPMIIGLAVGGYWYAQRIVMLTTNPFSSYSTRLPSEWLLLLGLGCALAGIVLFTTSIACCLHIYDSLGAEALTVRRVWEEARKNLLPVLGQYLLLGIIVALITMARSVSGIFVVVGLVGFWWMISTFFPLVPVRVVEHAGVGESFSRCMQLARGRRWSNLGMILLSSLFGYLLSIGFITPYYVIVGTSDIFNPYSSRGDTTMTWTLILFLLLMAVGLFVAMLYTTVTHYIHYYNLAERTDHWRLMERIEALQVGNAAKPGEVARA